MSILNGTWIHRSFRNYRPDPAAGADTSGVVLAAPWAPPGVFDVSTDTEGAVTGELTFSTPRGEVVLAVSGQVHEPKPAGREALWPLPASVELTATVGDTEYRLRGWLIPDSNAIAGTVLSVRNDLAEAPDGTMGTWVLVKPA